MNDTVMLLQWRILVQFWVYPRQVVGLAIILDRQLPVAGKVKLYSTIGASIDEIYFCKILPAFGKGLNVISKRFRGTG